MFELLEILILVATAVAVSGLVYYSFHLSQQVQYVLLADGRRQERSLPILIRMVLPLAAVFPRAFTAKIWQKQVENLNRKVVSAGFDGLITGREILMCQFWFCAISLVWSVIVTRHWNPLIPVIVVCLTLYPALWLDGAMKERHEVIQRGLPYVLDLLTLCVEAGLDFMSALSRIVERRQMDALSEELMRVFHGIKLGRTRRQSLRELRDRVNQPDLTVVVNALVQADELGVSLGAILRIQSDQLRVKRFQRAESLANQAPTKLLLPLLFIFGAAFIILVGPVLLQIFQRL